MELLRKYVIDQKIVVIIGDPSEEFMKKSGDEEKQRIEQQVATLGEDGLKQKATELETAITNNSVSLRKMLYAASSGVNTRSMFLSLSHMF